MRPPSRRAAAEFAGRCATDRRGLVGPPCVPRSNAVMLGLSEIAVIAAIVLFLFVLGGRSRRARPSDPVVGGSGDVWEARATIRIPKYLVTVLLALAAAGAVAGAALWLQFPGWVGALSGGLVAGAGVVAALQKGRRSRGS